MKTITYKGVIGKYQQCNDGNVAYYAGSIPGIKQAMVLFEGETIEELRQDFQDAVNDCIAHGYVSVKPAPRRISIPFDLYNTLCEQAAVAGLSVSSYAQRTLASALR